MHSIILTLSCGKEEFCSQNEIRAYPAENFLAIGISVTDNFWYQRTTLPADDVVYEISTYLFWCHVGVYQTLHLQFYTLFFLLVASNLTSA